MKLEQTTLFGVRGERVRIKKSSPLAKIAVGETVDFHLRIGGEVTSAGHTALEVWPKPNNFGRDVARISGKGGWVATAALTRAEKRPDPDGKPADPCDGCLRVGVANCLACIEKGGGTAGAGSGSAPDGRRGAATGCGLLVLLAAAVACFALAWAIDRRGVSVRVAWLTEYPDPACERCGKILDGKHNECVEEVE